MSIVRVIHKFRLILSKHQKIRIIELAILMIIAGFLEMLSVSLVLPFVDAVINPEDFMVNKYVQLFCKVFEITEYRTFLIGLALVMAGLYVLKNTFLLFQMMIQSRFVNNNRFAVQKRLLSSYMGKPYEYFLDVKSGDVIQSINNDTSAVFGLLTTLLSFFSESVVSLSLIITILVIAPGITLGVAALMFLMVGIIQILFRPRLQKIGMDGRQSSAKMNQWLLQSTQGIKEIKIMRREKFFLKRFDEIGKVNVKSAYLYSTLSQLPRFMIEATSMASFFVVIAVMISNGVRLESIIPMLSGIAMAAIRLLPSVNRISSSLATLSYNEVSLNKMYDKLVNINESDKGTKQERDESVTEPETTYCETTRKDEILSLDEVSYRYPKGEADILDCVNMTVNVGQSIGIVGPSGAGKTTTMDIALGLLPPKKGMVRFRGKNIQVDMDSWLDNVGYIPQSIFILDSDIRDNVAFGVEPGDIDDERVWKALKDAALDDFVRTLPEGLDTQLGEQGLRLSGGQRQRIGIARALYSEPEVLFFDEATSALDNETENAIMESINRLKGNKTMIIIAHRLSTIEGCNHIYRVDGKKIIQER